MSAPLVAGGPRVRTPAHQSVSRRGRCAHTHVMRACATPSGPQWAHGMVKGTCVEKCEGERHWISRVLATVGKRSRVAAPMQAHRLAPSLHPLCCMFELWLALKQLGRQNFSVRIVAEAGRPARRSGAGRFPLSRLREALSRGPEPGARRSAVVGKWASAIGRLSHRHVVRNALS